MVLPLGANEAAHHVEHAKTAFYVAGGLLALWAVVLSAIGLSRPNFPGGLGRLVILVSALLVVAAMATAVITA